MSGWRRNANTTAERWHVDLEIQKIAVIPRCMAPHETKRTGGIASYRSAKLSQTLGELQTQVNSVSMLGSALSPPGIVSLGKQEKIPRDSLIIDVNMN